MKHQHRTHVFLLLFSPFLLAIILAVELITTPSVAHAATDDSSTPVILNGTWLGQGTYSNGSGFDMLLTIKDVSGTSFSGTLAEDTYTSAVTITGNIISSSNGNATITFTDPSTLWGGQIALDTTYTTKVSDGQMSGSWYYSGNSSPDGELSLFKTYAPTLTSDCGHLVVPWVALYQSANFGGRELCFEGTGLVDLSQYGFVGQTTSVNIAAGGVFYTQPDGQGNQQAFYYGEQQADLGAWANQIASFIITGSNSPAVTVIPGGMWVYPNNGFTFHEGNTYTIVAQAYPTVPNEPVIDHVNVTGYWNNTWHVLCSVHNTQIKLGNFYFCSTDFLVNGQYPPNGEVELSFDVYDVAGNYNLAPNGVHVGTFSTTPAPVTFFPNPPSSSSSKGQIDPIIQDYVNCVTEVFFEKYAKIPGLNNHLFKLLNEVYDGYSNAQTTYSIFQDIQTGQLVAVPVDLAKAYIPGASCYQVIL